MSEFYVIRQTLTRIPGGGDNDPVFCEVYDSESDFVKSLIDYFEDLIDELNNNTNYFEDDDGIDALSEIREHIANLNKHIASNGKTLLNPEDYGFKGLWWYWINVYVATYSKDEYEKYIHDNLRGMYDDG